MEEIRATEFADTDSAIRRARVIADDLRDLGHPAYAADIDGLCEQAIADSMTLEHIDKYSESLAAELHKQSPSIPLAECRQFMIAFLHGFAKTWKENPPVNGLTMSAQFPGIGLLEIGINRVGRSASVLLGEIRSAWDEFARSPSGEFDRLPALIATIEPRIKPQTEPDLFYIQDTRGYVGNCISWWREGGGGYTCDVREAMKVAATWSSGRDTDKLWPCSVIDKLIRHHVDMQELPREVASGH